MPTIRIADEEVLEEKIGEVARLIGTEKFYLRVGGLLYTKGGMISDGDVVAGRRIDEKVRERSIHKRRVINPSVGELVGCLSKIDEFNEVRAKYMMQRVIEGASMTQAKKEAEEVGKVYQKVQSKVDRVESARQNVEKAMAKHEKVMQSQPISAKGPVQALQNAMVSEAAHEIQQALFVYKQEVETAKAQISRDLADPTLSANVKQHLRQVGLEFCRFADCMIGTLNQIGYACGELVIPGGMAAYDTAVQGGTLGEAVESQRRAIGEEFAITQSLTAGGGVALGTVGYAGYKLSKCWKALKHVPLLERNFMTKLYSKGVNRTAGEYDRATQKVMDLLHPDVRFNVARFTDPKSGQFTDVFISREIVNPQLLVTDAKRGPMTNLERMKNGLAPKTTDKKSVHLHHLGQNDSGALIYLSEDIHSEFTKMLHGGYGYGSKHPLEPVSHDSKWGSKREDIHKFMAKLISGEGEK